MKRTWVLFLIGLTGLIFALGPGSAIAAENIQQFSQLPSDAMSSEKFKQLPPDIQEQVRQQQEKQNQTRLPENEIESDRPDETVDDTETDENESLIKDQGRGAAATVSIIEEQYRKGYSSILSGRLTQFGYDVFNSARIQETSLAIPDPEYTLGTGDQLSIRLWGSGTDTQFSVSVDREGTINVPQIGILHVAGVRYGDIESVIRKEAEKYVQGINLSVTLTKLRSMEIFVVGAVRNPGLHVVPAFSTILDGLLRAGGVKKSGSLRQIRLNRGNKHKTAAVAGGVVSEAIFELEQEKNIRDLVKMAGGVLPQAAGSRIYLRRFENNQHFIIHDINTESISEWAKYPIQNGDLVEVTFSSSQQPYVVRLQGHVWAEDVFKYEPGMKLSEVLPGPTVVRPDAIMDFALIYRYDVETSRIFPMRFPLSKVFTGEYDAPLHPFDRIQILSREGVGILENFSITGAVWNPGEYKYKQGLRLDDALALAGGLKFGARKDKIEVARLFIEQNRVETEYLLLDSEKDKDFVVQSSDAIMVPEIKNATRIAQVAITGEVAYPGTYSIRDGEKLSELIQRAGGFSEYAYFYGAKYTSEEARVIQQKSIDQMVQKLRMSLAQITAGETQTTVSEEALETAEFARKTTEDLLRQLSSIRAEGRISIKLADLTSFRNSLFDFRIKNGDTLHIPPQPSFVSVVGSVYSPGSFLYEPNKTLSDYLANSGGISKTGDKKYMYLLKANGEILSMTRHSSFFSKFGNTVLMPGDTIVVPENLERVPYMRLVKDISDIAFKIATTAGVAFAIGL